MSTLSRGDEGPEVLRLQEILSAWGVPMQDPPGHFGLWTEAALFVLQHSEGLEPDGIYGSHTAARLADSNPPDCFKNSPITTLTYIDGVPYKTQRDNAHDPNSTCNVTVLAMAMLYHGGSGKDPSKQFEDELYELIRSEAGQAYYREHSPDLFEKGVPANQVYDNMVFAAAQYGFQASFSGKRSWDEIEAELAANRPVMLSTTFTASGHIVLLIGKTQSGDLICHDPYGEFKQGYKRQDGTARVYSQRCIVERLKEVNSDEKWALFLSR